MPELVGSMSFGQSKVTTELLKMIGCKNDGESVSDSFVEKVTKCQSTVILLYRPLSASLQFALNQSKDLESELTAWTDQALCILKLAKSYRKHVLLFQEKLVSENPKAFISQCQAKGIIDQPFDFESSSTSLKVSYVYDLVAAEIKRRHPSISRLESQLEALSIPLTEDVDQSAYNPLDVLAEHKQLRSRRDQLKRELVQTHEKISSLSDKNSLLSNKLKQAELSAQNAKSDLLASSSLVEMNNNLISQLNNRVGILESEVSNGNSENAALLNQLHIVQETLEAKIIALNDSLEKSKELLVSLNKSEADLKTKQKRIEELNKKLKVSELGLSDLQEKNKTILKQLSAAINEVKSISGKNQLLQNELEEVNQYSKRLSDQKNRLTKALNSVEQKLTEVTEAWSVSDLESARLSESLLAIQNEKNALFAEKALLLIENHSFKKKQDEQLNLHAKLEEQKLKLTVFESERQSLLEKLRAAETVLKEKQKRVEDLEISLEIEKKSTKELKSSTRSLVAENVVSKEVTGVDQVGKQLLSLKEENSYLLEQLHCVQEELRAYFIKYNDSEEQKNRFSSCLPSLLALLRKYPYTQLSKKNQMEVAKTLFDSKWYLSTYLDVAQNPTSAKDPFSHFLHHGFFEGRNPNADLNTLAFIQAYPEVLSSDRHPLLLCVERLSQN
ncbi:hypothetical protein DN062_02695 [Nitrincola tibetensis]|uniref:Uncharacterized protein n=1 Tax=Nitrincola tibetensis TaxID=2219697 RepID=A0A364NQ68_9GAMM|nr:hypothetical protein [Nitrincola tibetensis]RAU19194.1 hypothetical protein DN062_02695 [Nitrincola tibetensis]